jgi:hypothetical protein
MRRRRCWRTFRSQRARTLDLPGRGDLSPGRHLQSAAALPECDKHRSDRQNHRRITFARRHGRRWRRRDAHTQRGSPGSDTGVCCTGSTVETLPLGWSLSSSGGLTLEGAQPVRATHDGIPVQTITANVQSLDNTKPPGSYRWKRKRPGGSGERKPGGVKGITLFWSSRSGSRTVWPRRRRLVNPSR